MGGKGADCLTSQERKTKLMSLDDGIFYEGNDDQWIFIPGLFMFDLAGVKIQETKTCTDMVFQHKIYVRPTEFS